MKFLTQNNRFIAQQTCRLFAIAIRQEGAVNNAENDFKSMDMVPQIGTIIAGIASDDKEKQQRSLGLFRKYQGRYKWKLRNGMRRYDKSLWQKFIDIVLKDAASSQLNVEIALHLFVVGENDSMMKVVLNFLKTADFSDKNNSIYRSLAIRDDTAKDGVITAHEVIRSLKYNTDKVMCYYDELIPCLCQILRNRNEWSYDNRFGKSHSIGNITSAIARIARFCFIKYNKLLMDNGILDILNELVSEVDLHFDPGTWEILSAFVETPGDLISVEEVMKEKRLIDMMIQHPQEGFKLIRTIFEYGTDEQRMNIINPLTELSTNDRMSKDNKNHLLNVLKRVNDTVAYQKFQKYTPRSW